MFDRGKPSEAASPSTSPDRKMAPTQGSYMNNEQFCLFFPDPNAVTYGQMASFSFESPC